MSDKNRPLQSHNQPRGLNIRFNEIVDLPKRDTEAERSESYFPDLITSVKFAVQMILSEPLLLFLQ